MNHQNFLKKNFQKVFINRSFITFFLLSMSTVSPFSLESGCKISALKHIHQTFIPTFSRLFCKTLILKEVGRKDFGNEGKRDSKHTLILLRAHVYVLYMETCSRTLHPIHLSDGMGNFYMKWWLWWRGWRVGTHIFMYI